MPVYHIPTLSFRIDPAMNVTAPTEIFASQKYSYPGGMAVSTSSNVNFKISAEAPSVVVVKPADPDTKGDACVSIRRK